MCTPLRFRCAETSKKKTLRDKARNKHYPQTLNLTNKYHQPRVFLQLFQNSEQPSILKAGASGQLPESTRYMIVLTFISLLIFLLEVKLLFFSVWGNSERYLGTRTRMCGASNFHMSDSNFWVSPKLPIVALDSY